MSYRNDPYDPKQAALLDPAALDDAVAQAEKAFAGPEALVRQIGDDIAAAREVLTGPPPASPWDGL